MVRTKHLASRQVQQERLILFIQTTNPVDLPHADQSHRRAGAHGESLSALIVAMVNLLRTLVLLGIESSGRQFSPSPPGTSGQTRCMLGMRRR